MIRFSFLSVGFLISIFSFIPSFGNELAGKVITVIDGNTVELRTADNEVHKFLLYGIDCPELEQPYGDKARRFLEKLTLDRDVTVKIQGKDRWGNNLAIILLNNETDLRLELLKEGLAWTSERNPIQELETLKDLARDKGKGLWKEQDAVAPWIYRRQQTMMQAKSS